jgi:hypothetical protein
VSKSTGMGDSLYVGGYDLSGDTQSFKLSCPIMLQDATAINQLAHSRMELKRDADWSWVNYFNPTQAHVALSPLTLNDLIATWFNGAAVGNEAACMVAKQIGYDPTRAADGSVLFALDAKANGYGMEYAKQLTAGIRTDTVATNGTGQDGLASSAFGMQAYLQVFAFTGTDVTVKLQDSADNAAFADLAGAGFAQITSGTPQAQRIAISNSATVRRYVRASTVTTGGFSNLQFAVAFNRNPIANVVF